MEKVAQGIFSRMDNDLYDAEGDIWRQINSPLYLLLSVVNPVRLGYFKRILPAGLQGKSVLEVGCGGGLLSEELARIGFDVTGVDPSEASLHIASGHARANGLQIKYATGTGEALPHRDNSFDAVFCCDVLEHVSDLPAVISEIARVLKPGGIFCYDTFNRTFMSRLVAINIAQNWKWWAFAPPDLHVWEMFIKPEELKLLLARNQLEWREHRGMEPGGSLLKLLHYLRQRAKGKLTYKELGKKFGMVEGGSLNLMYMGHAVKRGSSDE